MNANEDVIKKTFHATTQFARSGWIMGDIHKTFRAPFPAMNVIRRNEPVATDSVFSDTPSFDGGYIAAQFFVGIKTKVCDVYGLRNERDFISTLQDVIRKRGAMDKLVSDRAQVEISTKVRDVLRHLCINDWQSEPHCQHQNMAERKYQDVKRNVNRVLNLTGAPPEAWFHCMEYTCFVMNRMAIQTLDWRTPMEKLTGVTPDISMIYRFRFWDEIYYRRDDSDGKEFPSLSNEEKGRFIGYSESTGHQMTYKVLTDSNNKIIFRSRIKISDLRRNLRIDKQPEKEIVSIRKGKPPNGRRSMALIDPDDLVGRTYLTNPDDSGDRDRLRIVEAINKHHEDILEDPSLIEFKCTTQDGRLEEIKTYNELLDKVESLDDEHGKSRFKSIDGHNGPLKQGDI